MDDMSLQGDVGTMPVRDLLGWLGQRRASGTLSLSRGMVVRRFHLSKGQVALASTSEDERPLGKILVDSGALEPAHLDRALSMKHHYGERLGLTLMLSGLVTETQLRAALVDKAQSMLVDALAWRDGRFVFEDEIYAEELPVVPVALDLLALVEDLPPVPEAARISAELPISIRDEDVLEAISLGSS
jgi:hypothetical protein